MKFLTPPLMKVTSINSESYLTTYFNRGVSAGWARAHPLLCLTFIEKGHLPTHFLLQVEYFLVLPTHFEEASYALGV